MNAYCTCIIFTINSKAWFFVLIVGIIAKEPPSSFQQEIQELRGSAGCLRSEPEFEMADIFYFCRRGVESILDDEVTKRFSAQELESWNLLTRSNYNLRHISLRLTVLWGLGVLVRYGILLPLRSGQGSKIHLIVQKRQLDEQLVQSWVNYMFFFSAGSLWHSPALVCF